MRWHLDLDVSVHQKRNSMVHPKQFYIIVDRNGNIVAFRDGSWKPTDVSPYTLLHWTGMIFAEIHHK